MSRLSAFTSFLSARDICPPIRYVIQSPRPQDFNNHRLDTQEARRAKLPSPRALEALAEIYRHLATEPRDRLRIAAVAILVTTGFRIAELVSLPYDCEIHERSNGKDRYGIQYHRAKTGGGKRALAVRWLSPAQAELASQAISEIRSLTSDARTRAKELEAHPDRVTIPGYESDSVVTIRDLMPIIGMVRTNLSHELKNLAFQQNGRHSYYRVADLEQHFLPKRLRLWVIKTGTHSEQRLSDTLLIAYQNFFAEKYRPNLLFVESLSTNILPNLSFG